MPRPTTTGTDRSRPRSPGHSSAQPAPGKARKGRDRRPGRSGRRLRRERSSPRRIPAGRRRGRRHASRRDQPPGTQKSWRRPIFPKGCPLSIFGAGELDFHVRDGNGYGLSANVTRISCVWTLFGCDRRGPKAGAGAVASRSSMSLSQRIGSPIPAADPRSAAEEVKPSTVSTAQLHPSPNFHMRPIEQVVSLRSYPVDPVGNLISRRASHLDAFSAYPDRT